MKCKLLVAEDELIERKVLCKTLQKYLGDLIVLYEARNGREALELFAREAPQVVILDIEMPGYTGLEVARKIRETDKNCGILFLTGYDKFAYAKQAIAVRALDYLLKPYKEQELVFAVEDAIRQVSARSTPLPPRVQPTAPLPRSTPRKRTRMSAPPSSGRRCSRLLKPTTGRISRCRTRQQPCATRMPISARGSSSASRSTFRPISTSTGWGKHGSWCWTPASA